MIWIYKRLPIFASHNHKIDLQGLMLHRINNLKILALLFEEKYRMAKYTDPVKFVREKFGPDSNAEYKLEEEVTCMGIKVPLDTIVKESFNMLTVQEVLELANAEVRSLMIRLWKSGYPEEGSTGFTRFIADGGGELYMSPQGPDDYQDGAIYKIETETREGGDLRRNVGFALKLVNQTIEPGAEELNEEDRKKKGLTEGGYKIYVLCLLSVMHEGALAPCGEYYADKEGNLIPSVRIILEKAKMQAAFEAYAANKYLKVMVPFKNIMDTVGWTWALNPGEYKPDVES